MMRTLDPGLYCAQCDVVAEDDWLPLLSEAACTEAGGVGTVVCLASPRGPRQEALCRGGLPTSAVGSVPAAVSGRVPVSGTAAVSGGITICVIGEYGSTVGEDFWLPLPASGTDCDGALCTEAECTEADGVGTVVSFASPRWPR